MDVKEQIKARVSIADVVSLYVELKPVGKNFKALCPFHTEKTPSFFVMPDKDSYTCYGCNRFGDIFSFIQEVENIGFPEAINFLIDKFNIPVDRSKNQGNPNKDQYTHITEIALKYFKDNLWNSPESKKALTYLEQRGIQRKTIDLFRLGYADNRWDGLYTHLKNEKCQIEKAVELGLLVKNESQRIYDRFRGRVIFPIFNESGAPIAFGGRTIFDEPSKYLNSPDTPLYKKSKHLYGFHLAKKAIREKNHAILVEGYFDMISLFQNGVENAAASLGTALTETQIYLLKRFSDKIHIFYDSDKAGIEAAVRGIEKMFEQNINPGIILLSNAKDPDEFIREKGLKAFNELIAKRSDGFRFLLHYFSKKYDLTVPERKNDAVREVMGFVNKISEPIIRDEYTRMTADFFNVDENLLKINSKSSVPKTMPGEGQYISKRLSITPAERLFLESILTLPELLREMNELFSKELLSVLPSGNIIRLLFQYYNHDKKDIDDYRKLAAELNDAERSEFRDIFEHAHSKPKDKPLLEKQIETIFPEFFNMKRNSDIQRINRQIKAAERDNNMDLVRRLVSEKTKCIQSKYNKLHQNDRRIS